MTGDDLRALSAAATPGPWVAPPEHPGHIWHSGDRECANAWSRPAPDAELIVWLVNHADALADLIDAVKAFTEYGNEAVVADHQRMVDALAALEADW